MVYLKDYPTNELYYRLGDAKVVNFDVLGCNGYAIHMKISCETGHGIVVSFVGYLPFRDKQQRQDPTPVIDEFQQTFRNSFAALLVRPAAKVGNYIRLEVTRHGPVLVGFTKEQIYNRPAPSRLALKVLANRNCLQLTIPLPTNWVHREIKFGADGFLSIKGKLVKLRLLRLFTSIVNDQTVDKSTVSINELIEFGSETINIHYGKNSALDEWLKAKFPESTDHYTFLHKFFYGDYNNRPPYPENVRTFANTSNLRLQRWAEENSKLVDSDKTCTIGHYEYDNYKCVIVHEPDSPKYDGKTYRRVLVLPKDDKGGSNWEEALFYCKESALALLPQS